MPGLLNRINKIINIQVETEIFLQFTFFHVENMYPSFPLLMPASNIELVLKM